MKNLSLLFVLFFSVACIQTNSDTPLNKYTGDEEVESEDLTGTYKMSCYSYNFGNGTTMSQAEEVKIINSERAQWKMIYYFGKANCPDGQEDQVDVFDMEYSYDDENKIFYERNYRLKTAFYGSYLDEANNGDGHCGLPNWTEGVFRDVTNLGQEDGSCLSGFFVAEETFYPRANSYLSREKIVMFGRDYLRVNVVTPVK